MTTSLTESKVGRPTKYSEELVSKLESILQIGETVETACNYAGISKQTYSVWLKEKPDFLTRIESAKKYADIAAANVVVETFTREINPDVDNAKWWLEKRRFRDTAKVELSLNKYYVELPTRRQAIEGEVVESAPKTDSSS